MVEGSRHFRRCRLAPPGIMGLLLSKTGPTHVGDTFGAAGSLAARPLRAAAGNGCCWLRGGSLLLPLLAADAGRRHLLLRRRRQLSAPSHVQLQPRRSVTLGVRAPLPLTHLGPLLVVHWVVPGEQYAPSIAWHTLHVFVLAGHDWHLAEGQWRQLLPLLLVLDRIVELPRQDDTWQVAGSEEATKCRTLSSCTDLVPMLEVQIGLISLAASLMPFLLLCGRKARPSSKHSSISRVPRLKRCKRHAASTGVRCAQLLQDKNTPPWPRAKWKTMRANISRGWGRLGPNLLSQPQPTSSPTGPQPAHLTPAPRLEELRAVLRERPLIFGVGVAEELVEINPGL